MGTTELQTLTDLLDLEGFEVVEATSDRAAKVRRLTVVPTGAAAALCPACGCVTADRHACHDRAVIDLPLGGWGTQLVVQLWQFECAACGRYFTPRHAALADGAHATGRFLDRLTEYATHGDVSAAARFLGVPEKTAERWYYDHLGRARREDRRAVPQKKYRQFCCVLIDHTNGRVLDVLESRDKATVVAWLSANKAGLLAGLNEVTCDMWDAYAEAAREVFGATVRVTIDRFHVMKNFHDRLNEARRELQNRLPADQKKELKGSRWLWVTNPENLTAERRAELDEHKRRFPDLAAVHDHRERLRQIFEDRALTDPALATERLRAWAEHGKSLGLTALAKFNNTLENWMSGIANYFVWRSSNGRTEGFNRGLRSLLWRACGMTNFARFRLRVLHAFS